MKKKKKGDMDDEVGGVVVGIVIFLL